MDKLFAEGNAMTCSRCGCRIPEGAQACPQCQAPVREPGVLERLFGWLAAARKPSATRVIQTTEIRQQRFEIVDGTGQRQVYHSLDEVPPEARSRIEEALRAGEHDSFNVTVKDAFGRQQTYKSLEEMPPDIRALYERVQEDSQS